MLKLLPKTASSREIQTSYRKLFDEVMESKEPLVILNNNKPEVVIVDVHTYEHLAQSAADYELEMAKHAIHVYETEKKQKKLKKLSSLADLL